MNKLEKIERIGKQHIFTNEGYRVALSEDDYKWLIDQIYKMNDSLHHIQIISSTMGDDHQANEIFKISDEAQLD
jgi:hypothetical protein